MNDRYKIYGKQPLPQVDCIHSAVVEHNAYEQLLRCLTSAPVLASPDLREIIFLQPMRVNTSQNEVSRHVPGAMFFAVDNGTMTFGELVAIASRIEPS